MFVVGCSVLLGMLLGIAAAGTMGGTLGTLLGFACGGLLTVAFRAEVPAPGDAAHPDTAHPDTPDLPPPSRHAHNTAA